MAADILTSLATWSTAEGSNLPSGTTAISTNLDDNLRMIQSVVRYTMASDTIASATTTDLGSKESQYLTVSGTTTITSLGTISAGIAKYVTFSGALTLTHNATSLILPGAANITIAAGDTARFLSLGSGNWKCLSFNPASGRSVVSSPQMSDGTVSLPGLPFASDLDSGIYRIGANNWALAAAGAKVLEIATTGVIVVGKINNNGTVAIGPKPNLNVDANGTLDLTSTIGYGATVQVASGSIASALPALKIYGGDQTNGGAGSNHGGDVEVIAGDYTFTSGTPTYHAGTLTLSAGSCAGNGDNGFVLVKSGIGAGTPASIALSGNTPTITSGAGTGATISGCANSFQITFGTGAGTSIVLGGLKFYGSTPTIVTNYETADIRTRATGTQTTITITFASAPASGGILHVIAFG